MSDLFPIDVYVRSVSAAPSSRNIADLNSLNLVRPSGNISEPSVPMPVIFSDRSGPLGPWAIYRLPAIDDGDDDRVVVGPNRSTRTYDTESSTSTAFVANGRSYFTPGIIMSRDMTYSVGDIETTQDIVDLWEDGGDDHFGDLIEADDGADDHETCALCRRFDESTDSGEYVWINPDNLWKLVYNDAQVLPDGTYTYEYSYYLLGFVTIDKNSSDDDIPRIVERVWGCSSSSVIYPINRGASPAIAKITDSSGIDAQEQTWGGSSWGDGVREWSSSTKLGTLSNPLEFILDDDDLVVVARGAGGKWAVISMDISDMIDRHIDPVGEGGTVYMVQLTSDTDALGDATCDVFGNGWDNAATLENQDIRVQNIADITVPSDQRFLAAWNDSDNRFETTLEINPPTQVAGPDWDEDKVIIEDSTVGAGGWWSWAYLRALAVVGCSANDSSPGTLDSALANVSGSYDSDNDMLVSAEVLDPSSDGTDESIRLFIPSSEAGKALTVWEATSDESSGEITAKRVNLDGSLAGSDVTFSVLAD